MAKPAPFLAFNAGYIDTLGFMTLHGLFTAHVTGNFVTIGAALALGTQGIVTKLLALPMFCVVVMGSRLVGQQLARANLPDLRLLLWTKIVLLAIAGAIAVTSGPFENGDAPAAMTLGLLLVAAMAIQNAIHRTHLTSEAPSTLMTGSTTQILLDLVDVLQNPAPEQRKSLIARLKKLGTSLVFFAIGCGGAALAYATVGVAGFLLPPVVALAAWWAIETLTRAKVAA